VLRLLAGASPGVGHVALLGGDVLAAFGRVDALVTDVSAVGLDYLFLRPECPIVLTDIRADAAALGAATPLADGTDVVGAGNIDGLDALIASRLAADLLRADRLAVRARYFGELGPDGESTRRFIAEVQGLCDLRDELVAARVGA
jgi:CDP-glycerol glycerophosphotransferase (TagB/SpsB family)